MAEESLSSDHNEEEPVICNLESNIFLANVLVRVPGDPGLRSVGWWVVGGARPGGWKGLVGKSGQEECRWAASS